MSENNILRLIEKFEASLESTEKLANTIMGLEGAFKTLDSSIYEIYELTKIEGITDKSTQLLEVLDNIKSTQIQINQEYDELINIKLYKENIKKELSEVKEIIKRTEESLMDKVDDSVSQLKEEMSINNMKIESKQNEIKEEILLAIKTMIESNNKQSI